MRRAAVAGPAVLVARGVVKAGKVVGRGLRRLK
jgi:hypothetical protein